ncbi:MAG: hypothetical protein ACPGED_09235 [Flavobacteriales bacterium]
MSKEIIIENRKLVTEAFQLLESADVLYYLLRPLELSKDVKDIDLVMPKGEVNKLVKHLIANGHTGKFSTSIAKNSIAIVLVNDMVLDIKTSVCFFKTKFLAIDEGPPYSQVVEENEIIVPKVSEDQLFTFWMLHFFLDKDLPSHSSTFQLFTQKFNNSYFIHLNSTFCMHWMDKVFGTYAKQANSFIYTYMSAGFKDEHSDNTYLRNLVLSRSGKIHLHYHIERIKYGLIRRIKRNLYSPLQAYSS